jgi:hypothetical protein
MRTDSTRTFCAAVEDADAEGEALVPDADPARLEPAAEPVALPVAVLPVLEVPVEP